MYCGPHAEVECLRAFGEAPVPADATMYVNLEPCAHHGKTPPCADLLIARGVKRVVIGCDDPNPLVKGQGIARMREAGIAVMTDVLREECRWLNRRFIMGMEQQRPYVILKWARSADGFLDDRGRTARITSPGTDVLVHEWRAEETAILVGSRTVLNDDPRLTVRHVEGRNPLRVLIDRENKAPASAKVFDASAPSLLLTAHPRTDIAIEQHVIRKTDDPIDALLGELHRRKVTSVLVEGGAELLSHFLHSDRWDEARVLTGSAQFQEGTAAPAMDRTAARSFTNGTDRIALFLNGPHVDPAWAW